MGKSPRELSKNFAQNPSNHLNTPGMIRKYSRPEHCPLTLGMIPQIFECPRFPGMAPKIPELLSKKSAENFREIAQIIRKNM